MRKWHFRKEWVNEFLPILFYVFSFKVVRSGKIFDIAIKSLAYLWPTKPLTHKLEEVLLERLDASEQYLTNSFN